MIAKSPPPEEVTHIGVLENDPEIIALKKTNRDIILVNRTYFNYLFSRYKKIRAADKTVPVYFYEEQFVHGYLRPIKINDETT